LVAALAGCTTPPAPPTEAEVTAIVQSFYDAVQRGDSAAAMQRIAPDALFIESGKLETRAEYEANHLPADIDFERQVEGKRRPLQIKMKDETAWVVSLTDYKGTADGDPVDFVSAQLMVLTRDEGQWHIRSIHWSLLENLPW
jgi:ketosteroid isomerase-like protein